MLKDVSEYMSDSEESFDAFLAACDDLIDSRYILAEGKISVLLQRVAGSKPTYALFESVLKGFDFPYEFTLAKHRTVSGGETVVLPRSQRKIAALVFCLLLDMDTGRCRLRDFLHVYFYSNNNPNWEFASFVKEIIVPFKAAVEAIHAGEADDEIAENEPDGSDAVPEEDLSDLETLFTDLTQLSDKVLGADLDEQDYDEATFTLNGLSKALSSADRDGIRLAYVAFRNTASKMEALDFLSDDIAAFGDKLMRLGAIPFV